MRNEDASQAGLNESNAVNARDDADHLAAKDFGPATGNLISGAGTINGSAGTDMGGADAKITAVEGAGGSDTTFAAGKLEVEGQYGTLTIDADGNYSYVRNAGTPAGVSDVFTYTLQGQGGASDTARLIINIGDVPMLATQGTRVVPGPDGMVVLPAGVELSDVRVVGRDLVVTLPDGSTMVIVDGAIFVPQLVLDGVEVPASNLAALLIGAEPTPAAGDLSPSQQSSGGNFALPPPPLDPGVPLGDLLPPTVLDYTPPTLEEINNAVDRDPVAGAASIQLDDDDVPGKNGNAGGPNDDAGSPNATGGGFLPGSEGDGGLVWALLSSGAPSGFTYNLQPDGSIQVVQVQGGNNVVVLTISVNADTGAYTVTENNPIRHAPGDTENNSIFVVNYSVTDDDGDVALGSLTINVDDDTPTVTVSAGSDANVLLTTDDAQTIGAASDTAVSLADFSGVFGAAVVSPGADGLGAGSSSSYTLNITGSASGLSSHGQPINLFMLNGVVVGTTGGQPASLADANIVFTVSVSNTGVVTLTQLQQIDHPIASDPTATGAPFADHIVSMADGLVTLTRSETVVDNDGDSVTSSASANIGANLRFTDDGPTISGAQINSSVTIDETDGAEPVSAGAPVVATSAAPIIVGGAVNYGADGQGPAPAYGLSLVNGAAIGTSIDSGLVTAAGGYPITLTLTSATLITATYQDGGTQTAFTIQINANGSVTVTQSTALEHGVDGPPGPAHDDVLDLINGETNLVNATVTYQDFDGDTATASAAIGGAIIFRDDGPSVTISAGSDENILLVTGDDGTEGTGSTTDSTTADFAGAFSIAGSNGGGDGTASTSLLSYALSTVGGDSGLTSHGNTINLYMVGTTVVGAIESQPVDLNDADIVFTVSVDGAGVVTLTQLQQIDHPAEASPVPGTDAPFADQTISMVDDGLITLTATATITDNDGDTATDSESIDIAANLVFQDDGPTIDATFEEGASLHIDESVPGVDGAGETDAVGLGQVTVALN
ncbi:MAG TPA: DUF5801 repeats-in-toxin domain-containing protein, partial [Sphingomicrobium sp.]|nr:DUF5801 repeats-in-toxin domain-containing protein [Sphingomicrobium sp.]